jgi:hypothetical protein
LARRASSRKSLRTCGLFSPDDSVAVGVSDSGSATVSGLHTCDSRLCPVCQARNAGAQLRELEKAAAVLLARGGSAVFVTATVPHASGDALGPLLDALQAGWNASMSGAGGKVWNAAGRVHYVRGLDYTHGANGHHPHYHAVLLFDRVVSDDDLWWLEKDLRKRWGRAIKRATGRDIVHAAIQVKRAEGGASAVIAYAGKALRGVLLETVWSQSKTHGGRTVWQVLAGTETSERDRELWREFEDAFHRRRWLVTSRGFLDLVDEGAEDAEDEGAEDAEDRPPLAVLSASLWRAIVKSGELSRFLAAVEHHTDAPDAWAPWLDLCQTSAAAVGRPDWRPWVAAAASASRAATRRPAVRASQVTAT